ncbi:carbon-nitrogen hydrolase family protein [Candidatus Woesearchaeota archaeon]|nr:carbon-nitrogen hydrolase family protein [Candidatus Woesearchaeota archaeon]
MPKTKICAIQFQVSQNFNKNISRVEQFFKKANKNDCDIICFPEIFLTGPLNKEKYNPKVPVQSKKLFSKLSKNYGMFSIMGSIIEKIDNKFCNISYLFDDKGNIVGNYKKNHLVQKSEAKYLTAGNEVSVFKTKIGNIGIQICRDLLYPEISRKLMLKKADIIFCPSFWSEKSSSYDWIYNNKYFKTKPPREVDVLVSARAIESEAVFVYANAAGDFIGNGIKDELLGRSQIALPFYGTTDILNRNKEGTLMKEIDLSIVKDAKMVYKIERDLKDYYKGINKV